MGPNFETIAGFFIIIYGAMYLVTMTVHLPTIREQSFPNIGFIPLWVMFATVIIWGIPYLIYKFISKYVKDPEHYKYLFFNIPKFNHNIFNKQCKK